MIMCILIRCMDLQLRGLHLVLDIHWRKFGESKIIKHNIIAYLPALAFTIDYCALASATSQICD